MSSPDDADAGASGVAASAHRSRWQRFSPSMGWRAFWSEIVIVVIGVVIALGANEAVQDWSWRTKVADAESRLKDDMAQAFFWSAEHRVALPCMEAQLEALTGRLLASGATLDPAPIHVTETGHRFVVRMPQRPYRFPVWDALLADGTAARFPPARQALFGRISDDLVRARLGQHENAIGLVGRLLAMGHPIALDAGTRRSFLIDLEELRWRYGAESHSARQRMAVIAAAGDMPAEAEVEAFLAQSGTIAFCQASGLPLADWRDYDEVAPAVAAPTGGAGEPRP